MSATSPTTITYHFATHKLKPVPQGKQGLVLVACGSFNPPTILHMRLFGKILRTTNVSDFFNNYITVYCSNFQPGSQLTYFFTAKKWPKTGSQITLHTQ